MNLTENFNILSQIVVIKDEESAAILLKSIEEGARKKCNQGGIYPFHPD